MTQPKILIIGDAVAPTGFARWTHNIAKRLIARGWDLSVLGINAYGDPHPYDYPIYPASLGGDKFGIHRTATLVTALKPDVVLIQNDAWNVPFYLREIRQVALYRGPVIAFCPPDAPNQPAGEQINDLACLVSPTQFGIDELRAGGYYGETAIIPYGIDLELYAPMDRREARLSLGFDERQLDAFVVGRADRNAPRKRYDLSTEIFAEWWKGAGKPDDAFLYYHCALHDIGWDLMQIARYFGLSKRVLTTRADLHPSLLMPEVVLRRVYNSWDLHFSTTLGEGFGLTALESAACGVAQQLPRWSAYGELWHEAAVLIPITRRLATAGEGMNATMGGLLDPDAALKGLDMFYRSRTTRRTFGNLAFSRATDPRFAWDGIANQWDALLRREL
jgi:glycosyltransferase involved in cell wall biosynthesis